MTTLPMTRRGALGALAASTVIGSVPALAVSDAGLIGDVTAYFDKWDDYIAAVLVGDKARIAGRPGVAALRRREERIYAESEAIAARIARTPAHTLAGALARLEHAFVRPEVAQMRAGGGYNQAMSDIPAEIGVALWRDLNRLVTA